MCVVLKIQTSVSNSVKIYGKAFRENKDNLCVRDWPEKKNKAAY